jgi:serine/threonine protein kinase/Flp pilus assembly protein TadD
MSDQLLEAVVPDETGAADAGSSCGHLVSQLVTAWRNGEPIDREQALSLSPGLQQCSSCLLELAYAEYCLRRERGELIDSATYCAQFPEIRSLLRQQLDLHELITLHPELLEPGFAAWPASSDTIQGFTVVQELGRGAFARVFLAREEAIGDRPVAIKVCRYGATEAHILGKLRHVNIVPIYSAPYDPATGLVVICMPYLGRATLSTVVEIGQKPQTFPRRMSEVHAAINEANKDLPASPDRDLNESQTTASYVSGVVSIGAQIADALNAAHRLGILHLDLKPSNVLMTDGGVPKLIDFNLAFDPQAKHQRLGGTLPYMSPEQIRCTLGEWNDKAIDHRSDIFSLGVLLYQLLTGDLPTGLVGADQRSACSGAAVELLAHYEAGLTLTWPSGCGANRQLQRIVERCVEVAPDRRYQDVETLGRDLRKQLTVTARTRRWLATHPLLVLAACVMLVGIGAGLALFQWTRPPYSVRQFEKGLAAFHNRRFAEAIQYCGQAISYESGMAQAYYLRGQSHADLGDFALAIKDLYAGYRLSPDPRMMAFLGYCSARERLHPSAIDWYQKARDAGFESAALCNNLGFSLHRFGQPAAAVKWFDIAIQLDPNCQEAYFNRALSRLWTAQQKRRIPLEAMSDIGKAIALGPVSSEHYRVAASICADAARYDTKHQQALADYLRLAVAHGIPLDQLQNEPRFAGILGDTQVAARLRTTTIVARPGEASQMVDPRRSQVPAVARHDRRPVGPS